MNEERMGTVFRSIRKQSGLSQRELADMMGVSQSAISNWESGKDKPNMDHLEQMMKLAKPGKLKAFDGLLASVLEQHNRIIKMVEDEKETLRKRISDLDHLQKALEKERKLIGAGK